MRVIKVGRLAIPAVLFLSGLMLTGCTQNGSFSSTMVERSATANGKVSEPVKVDINKIDTNLSKEEVVESIAITTAPPPKVGARAPVSQLDTTTPEQKKAATKPPEVKEQRLGATVASLGDPTEGGLWLKTPLVDARGIGRVRYPVNGKSVKVDLIPLNGSSGSGSQISLPALRLLEVPLTELPTLEVFKS